MLFLLRLGLLCVLLGNVFTLGQRVGWFYVYTVDVALVPLVLLFVLAKALRPREFRIRFHWLDAVMASLFALMLLSLLLSDVFEKSLKGALDWVRLAMAYLVFRGLAATAVTSRTLVVQFSIVGAVLVAIGLAQMVTGEPIGMVSNYFGRDVDQVRYSTVGARDVWRVSGPTGNSNVFAMWVIIFAGLAAAFALSRVRMIVFTSTMVGMATVILGTLSRAGTFGLFFFTFLLMWNFRRPIVRAGVHVPLLGGFAIVALVSLAFVSGVLPSLGGQAEAILARARQRDDVRTEFLNLGMSMLRVPKVALVGCGSDAMIESGAARLRSAKALSHQRNQSETGKVQRTGIHNVWFRTAVENGLPAAGLLAALISGLFVVGSRLRDNAESEWDAAMARYTLAIAVWFVLIPSQVYLMASRLPILLPLFLLLAFGITRVTMLPKKPPRRGGSAESAGFGPPENLQRYQLP